MRIITVTRVDIGVESARDWGKCCEMATVRCIAG